VPCAQVISLLEAYARKAPQLPLLARALPALLMALRRALHAGPSEQQLAERLRGLISNKLCKSVHLCALLCLAWVCAGLIFQSCTCIIFLVDAELSPGNACRATTLDSQSFVT
jgi:hypothetical protein